MPLFNTMAIMPSEDPFQCLTVGASFDRTFAAFSKCSTYVDHGFLWYDHRCDCCGKRWDFSRRRDVEEFRPDENLDEFMNSVFVFLVHGCLAGLAELS